MILPLHEIEAIRRRIRAMRDPGLTRVDTTDAFIVGLPRRAKAQSHSGSNAR